MLGAPGSDEDESIPIFSCTFHQFILHISAPKTLSRNFFLTHSCKYSINFCICCQIKRLKHMEMKLNKILENREIEKILRIKCWKVALYLCRFINFTIYFNLIILFFNMTNFKSYDPQILKKMKNHKPKFWKIRIDLLKKYEFIKIYYFFLKI